MSTGRGVVRNTFRIKLKDFRNSQPFRGSGFKGSEVEGFRVQRCRWPQNLILFVLVLVLVLEKRQFIGRLLDIHSRTRTKAAAAAP
jgi:hypothetical protein